MIKPEHIGKPTVPLPAPIKDECGTTLVFIDKILQHRKSGSGYQWLAAKTGAPLHEAEWQPTRDFIDDDGTMTKAFHDYVKHHILFPHLHHIVVDNNSGRRH